MPQAAAAQAQAAGAPAMGAIDARALAAALAGAASGSPAAASAARARAQSDGGTDTGDHDPASQGARRPGAPCTLHAGAEICLTRLRTDTTCMQVPGHVGLCYMTTLMCMQEEHRNEAGLLDLAASAQLRHQLSVLSMALQTAQLDPAQLGLKPTVRHFPTVVCHLDLCGIPD